MTGGLLLKLTISEIGVFVDLWIALATTISKTPTLHKGHKDKKKEHKK
jgi:hypothetical protein